MVISCLLVMIIIISFCKIKLNPLNLASKNYLVHSSNLDKIIIKKNHNKKIQVGSIIKILTVITALDNIEENKIDDKIIVNSKMLANIDILASVVGFEENIIVSVREILYSIIMSSGADATSAISFYLFGSEKLMLEAINRKSFELGMYNTIIKNVNGLDSKGQHTTLSDILLLISHSIKNEVFMNLFSMSHYKFKHWNKEIENKTLVIDKDIGVNYLRGAKSGYTYKANRCLASVSFNKGDKFIVITTGAKDKPNMKSIAYNDTIKILDYIFSYH